MNENQKMVINASDVFGMYVSNDAMSELSLQLCNCCQTCQSGKC